MCWEYEDLYGNLCFDFFWNDYELFDGDCLINLLEGFNIHFKNHKSEMICKKEFFDLLSRWHNVGFISPKNER